MLQFNDNPFCERATKLALAHLDVASDANVSLLRRLAYVTAVASQSVDDDVFVCSMLHPLAEYKATELPVIMTGLGYEAIKVVQALRETSNVSEMYERTKGLDSKYQAIVVARVMYRLLNIELYEYIDAENIIQEARDFTSKVDAPMDIMLQLEVVLNHATRVFNEIFLEDIIEYGDGDVDDDDYAVWNPESTLDTLGTLGTCEGKSVKFTANELTAEEHIMELASHKKLADELGVVDKQEIELEGVGRVTYYDACGFCDTEFNIVRLNVIDESKGPEVGSPNTLGLLSPEYPYEVVLHKLVAKSLGITGDRETTQLGCFGRVTYVEGKGFFDSNSEMVRLHGTVFEHLQYKYGGIE